MSTICETSARIISHDRLCEGVYQLWLEAKLPLHSPGQFVNISVPGFYLRRPISVCDQVGNRLRLVYKVLGKGTLALSNMQQGQDISILAGLGRGFDIKGCKSPLLIGGGLGVPPMLYLARAFISIGITPRVLIGFNCEADVILKRDFESLGINPGICTVQPSKYNKGLVTEHMPEDFDQLFACGPMPMLKALSAIVDRPYQFSYEERMACGFGACMGCTIMTKQGPRRVCVEGPVFNQELV